MRKLSNLHGTGGFTLIELMVTTGIFSIVILVTMVIYTQGLDLAAKFNRAAATTEMMGEGLGMLTNILAQVTHIRSCKCGSTENCLWDGSTAATAWDEPALLGGPTVPIFDADFESWFGSSTNGILNAGVDPALSPSITAPFGCGINNNAASQPFVSPRRGCKERVQLFYTKPVIEAGATPSTPGQLTIRIGNTTNINLQHTDINIGDKTNAQKIGLVAFSCGLESAAANQAGTVFVLNLRSKVKNRLTERTSLLTEYESWFPTGLNYNAGYFRESRIKISFPNMFVRGAYQWRIQSNRKCKTVGTAAATKEECCSFAMNATSCVACIRSGQASALANSCCSHALNGGLCK